MNDDRILRSPETLGLVRNYYKITSSKKQRKILELIQLMEGEPPEGSGKRD